MNITEKGEAGFVGYEYKELVVKRSMEPMYADSYSSFGWNLEGTDTSPKGTRYATLKLKRNRKIRNKAELSRLQGQFECCAKEIESLEMSKVIGASAAAYVIGVIGTAFLAGSVFAYINGLLLPSIILAIPGFLGWIVPYLCYRVLQTKKTEQVAPIIAQKQDEIYAVCEQACALLQA